MRDCDQFLALAEKQGTIVPLMIAHRMVGTSLLHTGDLIQARAHLDRAIALYDPPAHRPLATRFGQDVLVITLLRRSMALWTLGYPDAAVADTDHALSDAREIGHAATLLIGFIAPIWTYPNCGNYAAANSTNLSPWPKKKTPRTGRRWECWRKVRYFFPSPLNLPVSYGPTSKLLTSLTHQ